MKGRQYHTKIEQFFVDEQSRPAPYDACLPSSKSPTRFDLDARCGSRQAL
jgi:hypothetical protein